MVQPLGKEEGLLDETEFFDISVPQGPPGWSLEAAPGAPGWGGPPAPANVDDIDFADHSGKWSFLP